MSFDSSSESSSDSEISIVTLPKCSKLQDVVKNKPKVAIFTPSVNEFEDDTIQTTNIHIRVQQRRASSYITTVEGIAESFDLKTILRAIKKSYHCNGSITKDKTHGDVLQFSGDQRDNIKSFLTTQGICEKNQIIMHGF